MTIPLWMRAIAATIILLAIVGIGWSIHRYIWQSGYDTAKLEQDAAEKAAVLTRVAENRTIFRQQERDSAKLTKAHDDELAQTRAARVAAPRLSIPAAVCSGSAGTADTKSAGVSDRGNTSTRMVSAGTQQDFNAIEDRIETVFAGCRVAQQFIVNNRMAP